MDVDLWASRGPSAMHFPAVQAARLNHHADSYLNMDGAQGDGDMRSRFPCPFCCVEIEVLMICSHMQGEHCFDFKNAVCPICAASLGKDAIGHFTQQAHIVNRRRKSQKSGLWSSSSTSVGRLSRELSSFLRCSSGGRSNLHELTPDPLLSPFLFPASLSDHKGSQGEDSSNDFASTTPEANSVISSTTRPDETQEQDYEEKRQRAAFVQQLITSTIF